jgi:hypothetical protein
MAAEPGEEWKAGVTGLWGVDDLAPVVVLDVLAIEEAARRSTKRRRRARRVSDAPRALVS